MVTGKSGKQIFINYPINMTFNITRHIFGSGAGAQFALYNLSENNRSEILKDAVFSIAAGFPITLNAGYQPYQPAIPQGAASQFSGPVNKQKSLPLVFKGFVNVAYTERVGADLVTRIDAVDNGDIAVKGPSTMFTSSFQVVKGMTFVEKVKAMMALLKPNFVETGSVVVTSPVQGKVAKTEGRTGRVWDELQKIAVNVGGNVFIENGVCHMLGQNDIVPGVNNLGVLSSSSGLLNIPKHYGYRTSCSCVFEPALAIGKIIELDSIYDKTPNRLYKIIQYTHRGTISGSVSGDASSDIELMALPSPATSTL